MSAEQSYIDIYKQYGDLIKSNCAPVVNSLRDEAFDEFCKVGFPDTHNEDFQHSDVKSLYAGDYGINLAQFNINFNPYESFKCDIQSIKSHLFFVINDVFFGGEQAEKEISTLQKQGVVVGSLKKMAVERPDIFEKYYGKQAKCEGNGVVAFNTTFAMDGLFVYVPKHVTLDYPIQLINIMNSDVPSVANSRNLIVIDEDSHAQVLVCEHAAKDLNYLANRVSEIFVGENSTLELYRLEDSTPNMHKLGGLYINQAASSEVLVNEMTLQNGFTRNDVHVDFSGEHAVLNLYGMAIANRHEHIDNHTFVNHRLPKCKSNQLYKYVLGDAAIGSFDGKVLVCKDSQKTEAYQSNKNIVSTSTAKMFTKPHLEIYADDVKCSHGAAVGQLDENALFYMRQRGISEKEARLLLMIAFGTDVIDSIKIDALRTRMHMLIEKRFRGDSYECNGCDACHSVQ